MKASIKRAFTVNLTKGEDQRLNFSVVGKTCSICDGDVESDEATKWSMGSDPIVLRRTV